MRTKQVIVLVGFATMIAMFCLCVAYLGLLALGSSLASLVGLAALFSMITFSVSMSIVRFIKRRAASDLASPAK